MCAGGDIGQLNGLTAVDGLRRQAPAGQQACWFPTPSRKLEIDGTLVLDKGEFVAG